MKIKIVFPFILSVLFLFFFSFVLVKRTSAAWEVDSEGRLVTEPSPTVGSVLSKGDDREDEQSGSSGSGKSSDEKAAESKESKSAESTEPSEKEVGLTPKIKTEPGKTEIIFGGGEKIKTRIKKEETRTDVYSSGAKVRFEQKEGRLVIKAENETGQETSLGEQEIFKIEERLDKNAVKVATASADSFVFSRGGVGAKTGFPLSVDLATNALTVTTAAGTKTVTTLPDAAVKSLLTANVVDRLGPAALAEATGTTALTGVSAVVALGERSGLPIYEINGLSDQKLLGFIPVAIPRKAIVSAETGELLATEKTFPNTLLDLFSF